MSCSSIGDAKAAGLTDLNGDELRQLRTQRTPNPKGEPFARGIVQPFNIVQQTMIKGIVHVLPCARDVGKIHHPTGDGMHRPLHRDHHTERVAVQSRARMIGIGAGQSTGTGEREAGGEVRHGSGGNGQRRS